MQHDDWESAEWFAGAVDWLDQRLTDAGIERTGAAEMYRVRPWAAVLTAPTADGAVWMKAAGPGTAFEIGLYELLEAVVPERVLSPIAVDVEKAWIALPDGGTPLAERDLPADELMAALLTILPQYAELQRDLSPHVDRMLELGVADMRPAAMPQRFDEAINAVRPSVYGSNNEDERLSLARVLAMRDDYVSWCVELAGAPVATTIDHNDFHPANMLAGESGGFEQSRFYDWGDGVIAHPFSTMLVTLAVAKAQLGLQDGDARLAQLRDAYLEVFSDLASHRQLVATMELSCRVAKVARALVWDRAVRAYEGHVPDDFAMAPAETMFSLLDESYLGGA
jgi:hypothetical protein